MKRLLLLALLCVALPAFAQSVVIQGQVSAGSGTSAAVRAPVKVLSDGSIVTSPSGNAAAALADGASNPTTSTIGVDNQVFNGTTWDRMRGSTTNTGVALVSTKGVDPCQSAEVAKSSAVINVTTATTTQLVAISGSTTIYVCSFTISISQVATTANTIKFVRGTGSNCGTGTADLTGAFGTGGVTAAAPIVVATGAGHTQFKSAGSDALCVTTTIGASAAFVGYVTYVQQ